MTPEGLICSPPAPGPSIAHCFDLLLLLPVSLGSFTLIQVLLLDTASGNRVQWCSLCICGSLWLEAVGGPKNPMWHTCQCGTAGANWCVVGEGGHAQKSHSFILGICVIQRVGTLVSWHDGEGHTMHWGPTQCNGKNKRLL